MIRGARFIARSVRFVALVVAACGVASSGMAAEVAASTAQIERMWHFGRVTADVDRSITFYHEVLGLDLQGERHMARPYLRSAPINEFVDAPPDADLRAVNLPIPGSSPANSEPAERIYLELLDFRNVDRRQLKPSLASPGASSLRFFVRDLDALLTRARAADLQFITRGGAPVSVSGIPEHAAPVRAIMLRDPDGYPVELVEAASTGDSAQMTLIVSDLSRSLAQYRTVMGADAIISTPSAWQSSVTSGALRGMDLVVFRSASIRLPGSTCTLELIEFRRNREQPYRPAFHDIGPAHVAFIAKDMNEILARMKSAGMKPIARSGTFTQFNPTLKAVYTRDRDGHFIEIIERR